MAEEKTIKRARLAKRQGKSPSTQAGEFVGEAIRHIRQGAHGARSTKQAIAIGLSKARRAGVKLPPPRKERHRKRLAGKRSKNWPTRVLTKMENLRLNELAEPYGRCGGKEELPPHRKRWRAMLTRAQ